MVKITLSITDEALWLAFRVACLKHKTSASKALEPLMKQQLEQWEVEKDNDWISPR
jgi:hypothetical protein